MPHRPLIRCVLLILLSLTPTLRAQPIKPVVDRLDAIVSYPLVLSLAVEDEDDLRRGVTTRLDDGRTFVSTPFWVGLTRFSSLPAWTTSAGRWQAYEYESIRRVPAAQRPAGSWFISIPLPIDAVGQGLWFAQTRYELNWLPDPERSLLEADSAQRTRNFASFWNRRLDNDALSDPSVQTAIEQYHRDPFQNWRARLLTDGLNPDRSRARETMASMPNPLGTIELELETRTPGNDLLAAIARQQEARWQIILGRIWLIDPETAERMKQALMRTARFDARTLPLWSADNNGLARLAYDLVSPFVDDDTRVLRAKAWLETQPRAISWIIDDQGEIEAGTGRLRPSVGVISLPSSPGESLLRVDAARTSPELQSIPPFTRHITQIAVDPITVNPSSPMVETQAVTLRIGRWSARHELIASRIPAKAPYTRIGPLLSDWTMPALLGDRPLEGASPEPGRTTVGLLRRASAPSRRTPHSGWQLYFECTTTAPTATPSAAEQGTSDALSIWVGPRAFPIAAWRITPQGRVEHVARTSQSTQSTPIVETRVLEDRWIAQITLPESAFDEHGELMLGIERTDADGVHSAWPRRMIPGQRQPGRFIFLPDRYDNLRPR